MPVQGKTKIVCTLGPSTSTIEMLTQLISSGMDVARLNFSHGTREDHLLAIERVREAMLLTGASVAILQDLQGPKIRIGALAVPFIELRPGSQLAITTDDVSGNENRVPTTYKNLPQDLHRGEKVLLDDGKMELRVADIQGNDVICEVVVGGRLLPHKGINLPGAAVSAPSYTGKDLDDLAFGLRQGVDFVALSFVRSAEDIRDLRNAIAGRVDKEHTPKIIAKIEKPQAIANIDAIVAEADGIMIARGDLGVELPPEDVPLHQKMIIRKCNEAGKPVIIATQMLESMISSPTPTRAETSDVANAVIDGGDALMLSGETSVGAYPLEAVRMMARIILKVESQHVGRRRVRERSLGEMENRHDALGRAACTLADEMNAAAIVAVTHSGQTALVVSRYRPEPRIIAITDSVRTLRQLSIVWGIRGMLIDGLNDDSDTALQKIQQHLVKTGLVKKGEYTVLLAGQPFFAGGSTNFIEVEKVI